MTVRSSVFGKRSKNKCSQCRGYLPLGEACRSFLSDVVVGHRCENCRRKNVNPSGQLIEGIAIQSRSGVGLSFNKKLATISQKPGTLATYDLCDQCYETLKQWPTDGGASSKKYNWADSWPAFFWKMFSHQENMKYGTFFWQLLPCTMRHAWLESYRTISANHSDVSLFFPIPLFQDITFFRSEIEELNSSNTLANLVLSCNKNCYCSVKCPWGCSEYPDECGLVEFHKYLFSIFVKKGIKMPVAEASISSRSFDGFVGIVPDYLEQVKIGFLDDSHWPVHPSICFEKESGPMLCICSRHSSGSKLHYLHPPRNPLNSTMPSTRVIPFLM
jgi:hypothetical protein